MKGKTKQPPPNLSEGTQNHTRKGLSKNVRSHDVSDCARSCRYEYPTILPGSPLPKLQSDPCASGQPHEYSGDTLTEDLTTSSVNSSDKPLASNSRKTSHSSFQSPSEAFCSLCGFTGECIRYHPDSSLRETRCPQCGASRRTRDLTRVLMDVTLLSGQAPLCQQVQALEHVRIFELQAAGPLHSLLKTLPHYQCSEFFPTVQAGQRNEDGILCQDATRLTYEDETFDIVISQDILEHIDATWLAFSEINRVLRQSGTHIFTVPVREGFPTKKRAQQKDSQTIRHSFPPIYHGDPLNPEGALVWWDFGDDLSQRLEETGISASLALKATFYSPDEICATDSPEDVERYTLLRSQKQLSRFFLYNSLVFTATRPSQKFSP